MGAYFQQLLFGLGLGAMAAGLGFAFIPWDGNFRRFVRKHAVIILWIAVVIFVLVWWAKGASRYWVLCTSLADEGVFTSQLWNSLRGRLNSTYIYMGSYYLIHFAPSLNILALFYAPWQNPVWLYGLRAMGAGCGVLGIFYVGREIGLSRTSGLMFTLIWIGNVAVRGALVCEFHEVALVTGFFSWVVWFALRRQYVWCLLLALIIMGFKEDIPVYIGGLGLMVAFSFRRPLAGWLMVALAVGYYLAVTSLIWKMVIPAHIDYFTNKFPQFQSDTKSSLMMVLENPLGLITPVLGWDRLWGLIVLFMPVLFLPFMRWGWLGLILPLWLLLGMEGYNDLLFAGYYAIPIATLIVICAMPGLKMLWEKQRQVPKALFWAMAGLALGSNFAQNPEVNYYQFDYYGLLPHPYLQTVERMATVISTNASVSADVYTGSHFVNRKIIRVFPDNENWLSDYIIISNRMIDNPLVLLVMGELGYGEVISHPGFFFLERSGGMDAREDYMNRLRWMEAEATGWPLWTTIKDHRASGGIAEFIPAHAAYGDRSRLTPKLLLPPGNYQYKIRIATHDNPNNPFVLIFEVSFLNREGIVEVLKSKVVESSHWGKSGRYEVINLAFTVKEWGLTYLNNNFGTDSDIWWDGVGVEGLPSTFNRYFQQIFPQTLEPATGCLDVDDLITEENNAARVLRVGRKSNGKVVCRWLIDPNLPAGDYWIYYSNDSLDRTPLEGYWGVLELVKDINGNEKRETLDSLYISRKEAVENDRVDRFVNPVHLEPGCRLELRVNPELPGEVVLRKMWICNNVITENVRFYE